jgi:hypothetical protein
MWASCISSPRIKSYYNANLSYDYISIITVTYSILNKNLKKEEGDTMSKLRQQILILHLANPSLESSVVGWALYDGAKAKGELQMNTGDAMVPPFESVLDAMREGWNVLQLPILPTYQSGAEHDLGPLPYEYTLERKVSIDE